MGFEGKKIRPRRTSFFAEFLVVILNPNSREITRDFFLIGLFFFN